jgi:hypothetical protein
LSDAERVPSGETEKVWTIDEFAGFPMKINCWMVRVVFHNWSVVIGCEVVDLAGQLIVWFQAFFEATVPAGSG